MVSLRDTLILNKTFVSATDKNYLTHQIETLRHIRKSNMVINDNYTGSGKTIASLLYLNDLAKEFKKNNEYFSVVFISPINSLLYQTYNDVREYIDDQNLPFVVFPIMKYSLDLLEDSLNNNDIGRKYSRGEILTELFSNPIAILRNIQIVNSDMESIRKKIVTNQSPCVYIINPDILYYALFVHYEFHRNNIKLGLLNNIKYIVFDEFHYYTFYQLNMFFFLLSIWKINNRLVLKSKHEVKICLLSATPNEYITEILEKSLGMKVRFVNENSIINSRFHDHDEPFLSKLKLNIYSLLKNETFRDAMCSDGIIDIIKRKIIQKKYGLIVCNSIEDVQHIHRKYVNEGIDAMKITGSINQKDRQDHLESQVIISTNTVDLGFNFNRKKKSNRQNIDYAYIDYITFDDFIQRIGRCGRILKKSSTNVVSEANIFISNNDSIDYDNKFDKDKDTRFELLNEFRKIFPDKFYGKRFFEKYGFIISYIGYQEISKYSLTNREEVENYQDTVIQEIHGRLLSLLKDIYNVDSDYYEDIYKKYIISQKDFGTLTYFDRYDLTLQYCFDKDYNTLYDRNGFEELRRSMRKPMRNPTEEKIVKSLINSWKYTEELRFFHTFYIPTKIRMYHEYLRNFFAELKNNFRTTNFELTFNVIDSQNIFGSDEFTYNIFHILKYYDFQVKDQNEIILVDYYETRCNYYFEMTLLNLNSVSNDISNKLLYVERLGELIFLDKEPSEIPIEVLDLITSYQIIYLIENKKNYDTYAMLKQYNLHRIPNFDVFVDFSDTSKQYKMYIGRNALFIKNYFDINRESII